MRKRKTLEEKRAEQERINMFYRKQYNRAIKRKVTALNKIMSQKDVKDVRHDANWWTVYFKNGQVFKFTFLPPHLYADRKIIYLEE